MRSILYRDLVNDDMPRLLGMEEDLRRSGPGFSGGAEHGGSHGRWPSLSDDGISGWAACMGEIVIGICLADFRMGAVCITAVMPDFRGKGVGGELLRMAEQWLFSHGWKEIGLGQGCVPGKCAMAFYHRHGWEDEADGTAGLRKGNPGPAMVLEEHELSDPATGYTRTIRLQRGSGNFPHRLCLLLDGELYWREMKVLPLLNELCATGRIPPMTYAFVGHAGTAARQVDYICNERYADFLGGKVLPWLREEVPSLQKGGHAIVGLSLSGLMAVYQTVRFPELFSACLSQSGSHWWRHEWFAEMLEEKAPLNSRFWLSAGHLETKAGLRHPPAGLFQEISQKAGVEKAVHVLRECDATVRHHLFSGGHSRNCWHDEFAEAMTWLLADGK